MPASTTDDFLILTVGDDVLDIAEPQHAALPDRTIYLSTLSHSLG